MLRNRTLLLFGLAATASLGASGCIIGDVDNSAFIVSWDLFYVGNGPRDPGARVACEDAGTPTVDLEMRTRDGTVYKDSFRCQDGDGKSRVMPSGSYDVRISLRTAGGTIVSAQERTAEVFRRGLTDLGIVQFTIQSFALNWTLSKANMPTMCDRVGATEVHLITQFQNDPSATYKFPCTEHMGETTAILVGTYSVQLQLMSAAGAVLSGTMPMTFPVTATTRAVLPPITFVVN